MEINNRKKNEDDMRVINKNVNDMREQNQKSPYKRDV